jgi:polyhydroxyalkanoate synthesis regulator phasin
LRGSFQASFKTLEVLEDEILERVDAMAERGELTLSEAQELREEMVARGRERQAAAEEKIVQEVEESLLRLGVPSRSDVESLHTQLDEIGAKLDSLLSDSPSGE